MREAREPSAEEQLALLRTVLHRDYLTIADWELAVKELARMVKSAVRAQEVLVAIHDPAEGTWVAVTSGGRRLNDDEISEVASRSALERVRLSQHAEVDTGDLELDARSPSVHGRRIAGMLVVPIFFWDVTRGAADRVLGGCLYAHRTRAREPFGDVDVALVGDIARIAEPTLNLLRHLGKVETDLEATQAELQHLRHRSAAESRLGRYASRDPWMARNVLEPLQRAASVDRVGLVILGPTGSGKTHLAESYHNECPRRGRSFIVLNCGSFRSATILGPELFGFSADSGYQNAPRRGRPGKALLAHGGTLFLDEIGCLPMELQPQLLRLVEQGRFSPLGSSEELHVDVQLITATNEDLQDLVRRGTFREDLYWRISDVVVTLPPLSARLLDIEDLARSLLAAALQKTRRTDVGSIADGALQALAAFDWSRAGNIRGLQKTLERSLILAPAGTTILQRRHLVFQGLPDAAPATAGPDGSATRRSSAELETIKAAIRHHGKATAAAKALGLSYRELYWRLQRAGLSVHRVLLDRG